MLSPLAAISGLVVGGISRSVSGATSSFASFLSGPAPSRVATASDAARDLEGLEHRLQTSLDEFRSRMAKVLASAGIDSTTPIVLSPDGFGGIQADVDHPQFASIEALFARDAELRSAFQRVTALVQQRHEARYLEPLKETSVSVTLANDWTAPMTLAAAASPL